MHNGLPWDGDAARGIDALQPLFHPVEVKPPAKLEAAGREMSDGAVAAFLVEAHGVLVFPADEGVKKAIPLGVEDRFQRVVQRFPDAFAPCLRFEIDGRLGASGVCRPGKGQTCIGIAENLPVLLPEKPWELGGDVVVAAQEFFFAGWVVFKCGGRGQNVRPVNGKHGAYVFLGGDSEHGIPPVFRRSSRRIVKAIYFYFTIPTSFRQG